MKTLALYSNNFGEAQQCLIDHDSPDQLDKIELNLPEYSEGSTLFFINLYDEDERPDVVDEDMNEVSCHFLNI